MMNRLDRRQALPLYVQLKEALLDEIRDDGLQPGDRLATEGEIEDRFGVSRTTVRLALQALAQDGVVERIQGKGTFLCPPQISHRPALTSFTENMLSQGLTPSRRVLEMETRDAPDPVLSALRMRGSDRRCRFLRRLLLADGDPVAVAETWLPVRFVGEEHETLSREALEEHSLYELLAQSPIALELASGVETSRAALADADIAGLLRSSQGDPVLIVDRISSDPAGRVVEVSRLIFDGVRYRYRTEVTRPGNG
ncbi:MAG: GntR family transcriptional regulator [Nitriliruptoraceae bacterium]